MGAPTAKRVGGDLIEHGAARAAIDRDFADGAVRVEAEKEVAAPAPVATTASRSGAPGAPRRDKRAAAHSLGWLALVQELQGRGWGHLSQEAHGEGGELDRECPNQPGEDGPERASWARVISGLSFLQERHRARKKI